MSRCQKCNKHKYESKKIEFKVELQPSSVSISGGPGVAPSPSTVIANGFGLQKVTAVTIAYPITGGSATPVNVVITSPEDLLRSSMCFQEFAPNKREKREKCDSKFSQLVLTLPATSTTIPVIPGTAILTFYSGYGILGTVKLTITA
jgi:hypothetical protein